MPSRSPLSCSVTSGGPEQLVLQAVAEGLGDGRRPRRAWPRADPGPGSRGRAGGVGLPPSGAGGTIPLRHDGSTAVIMSVGHLRRPRSGVVPTWTLRTRSCDPRRCVLHCGVHVVVVGCGRVGSGLAMALGAEGHSVAIIDRNRPRPSGGSPDWDGSCDRGLRLRPRRPRTGRRPRGRRAGRRHQRRQHQHPDRPHRPRDLRDPQRGGPHLRPPAGRDLPAPRASPPWPRSPGPSTRCAAACCPISGRREWSDATGRLTLVDRSAARGLGRASGWPTSSSPGRAEPGGGDPGRRGPARRRRARRPGGRRRSISIVHDERPRRGSTTG